MVFGPRQLKLSQPHQLLRSYAHVVHNLEVTMPCYRAGNQNQTHCLCHR